MNKKYDASSITVLEGLDAVRKRPGMYIGSTSKAGLHHLFFEILDNCVDEVSAGFCNHVTVTLKKNNFIEVIDNGRGIPVDKHQKGESTLQILLTNLHSGAKFGLNDSYKTSGGLHGVGLSVVNALSSYLRVEVYRDGKIYSQQYEKGIPQTEVEVVGKTDFNGTKIIFLADDTIFDNVVYSQDIIINRIRNMAFLNKGLSIDFINEKEETHQKFKFDGGISDFVSHITKNTQKLTDIIEISSEVDGESLNIALTYVDNQKETIFSFVNNIDTHEGGTHVSGFKSAITRSFNDVAKNIGIVKKDSDLLQGSDVREGIVCVISVRMKSPQFEGQTKTKLGNSHISSLVLTSVYENLKIWLDDNYRQTKILLEKMFRSKKAREDAKKIKDAILKQTNTPGIATLPGQLTDCSSNKREECEIFLTEGMSGAGTAKSARSRFFQAILPLRGKVLNIEKTNFVKAMSNNEIVSMIKSFGVGIKEDFDINKLRYGKIIIMTDADVDGAHIRTLILTFFYRYLKCLIENGNVYIAQPPLYGIKKGNSIKYFYDDNDMSKYLKDHSDSKFVIQRYKGLGEMNHDQLWDTTMNPETRKLKKILIKDAIEADILFSNIMGNDPDERKKIIESNVNKVEVQV